MAVFATTPHTVIGHRAQRRPQLSPPLELGPSPCSQWSKRTKTALDAAEDVISAPAPLVNIAHSSRIIQRLLQMPADLRSARGREHNTPGCRQRQRRRGNDAVCADGRLWTRHCILARDASAMCVILLTWSYHRRRSAYTSTRTCCSSSIILLILKNYFWLQDSINACMQRFER